MYALYISSFPPVALVSRSLPLLLYSTVIDSLGPYHATRFRWLEIGRTAMLDTYLPSRTTIMGSPSTTNLCLHDDENGHESDRLQ